MPEAESQGKKKRKKRKPRRSVEVRREPQLLSCHLCGRIVGVGRALAAHLVKEYRGVSLAEYGRECPSSKPFDISRHVILGKDLYDAQVHRGITGKWPDWYNEENPVAFESGMQLAELLFSGFVAHKMEFVKDVRFAAIVYAQVLLAPEVVIRAARNKRTRQRIEEAFGFIDRLEGRYLMDVHAVFAEIQERLQGMGAGPSGIPGRPRFVAAEVMQSTPGDRDEQALDKLDPSRLREIRAQLGEISNRMQGLLFGEDHHMRKPPSAVDKENEEG